MLDCLVWLGGLLGLVVGFDHLELLPRIASRQKPTCLCIHL